MAKKKYYAVVHGFKPGIYNSWYGEDGAHKQTHGFSGARFKGFKTLREAEEWYSENINMKTTSSKKKEGKQSKNMKRVELESKKVRSTDSDTQTKAPSKLRKIVIYTDGGCINNPGPGGYGVVCIRGKIKKEYSGGFRETTNNRMELMACIVALQTLRARHSATIYSDSEYVVNGINKGWAQKWKRNCWMVKSGGKRKNVDLWSKLLELCEKHKVKFEWVKGHAGNPDNERCDELAMEAMSKKELPPDTNYEKSRT